MCLLAHGAFAGPLGINLATDTPESLGCDELYDADNFQCSNSNINIQDPIKKVTMRKNKYGVLCMVSMDFDSEITRDYRHALINDLTQKYGPHKMTSMAYYWNGNVDGLPTTITMGFGHMIDITYLLKGERSCNFAGNAVPQL